MSSTSDEILKRIEKDRYLIPCKCLICEEKFKDVILGSHHIFKKHPKRKIKNVIDNLSWDIKADLKKWEILQELKNKKDFIINTLSDETTIFQARIPDVVEIQRKKANISEIMKALLADFEKKEESLKNGEIEEDIDDIDEEIDERDFESSEEDIADDDEETTIEDAKKQENNKNITSRKTSKKKNLCELLERELEKYINNIKRLSMSSQVERIIKTNQSGQTQINRLAKQLDYFLGISKAIKIIKDSKIDLEIII
ncbi:MAG: hypothetical protein ACFFD2_08850 [Promethearchaeota archaeon]